MTELIPRLVIDSEPVPTLRMKVPQRPKIQVAVPNPNALIATPVPGPSGRRGPQGEQGVPGPAFSGIATWYGTGAPDVVVGAKPGDIYIDTSTGTTYELK